MLELDAFRTQQVVINLLSNALKFSKPFDIIHVKLKVSPCEQSEEVELQVDVSDSGCGISEQEQLQIFTPYFRSTNKASIAKNGYGNGIGLSICKRIMSHLGGSLSVESQLNVGTTFTISLRTKKSSDQARANLTVSDNLFSMFQITRSKSVLRKNR